MSNLAVALVGLLGVILGVGVAAFWQWMDRKERYRVMTFEKRLATHQEAFSLCHDLGDALFRQNRDDLGSVAVDMKKWWRSHCLFLDRASRENFLRLTNTAYSLAEEGNLDAEDKCWELLKKADRLMVEGIGAQYLPDIEPKGRPRGVSSE